MVVGNSYLIPVSSHLICYTTEGSVVPKLNEYFIAANFTVFIRRFSTPLLSVSAVWQSGGLYSDVSTIAFS